MSYNQENYSQGQQRQFGGPIGFAVKGLAAGIGLASESIQHHKEKKAAEKAALSRENSGSANLSPGSHNLTPATSNGLEQKKSIASTHSTYSKHEGETGGVEHEEADDEQWDLDDAQNELVEEHPKAKVRPFERDPKKMAQHFMDDYPVPQGVQLQKLALPVILPQRRPKDRTRGFIRAYAPELQKAGIDQACFIDFLETFNKATLESPWLNAINLAGFAFMAIPSFGISQVATIALYFTVQVAKNMQSRHRYNSVLDQINDGFYRPRGLYAMLLTWNPESDGMEIGINLNEIIGKNTTPPEGIAQKTKHSLRPSMANTNGVAFTETAPLIFPHLDALDVDNSKEAMTTKAQIADAKNFAADYFDRRAQAKHAGQNPGSHLDVGPKPTFTSRFSDPNNPSNSGDLLALLSGGRLTMPQRGGFGARGYNRGYDPYGQGSGNPIADRMAMSGGGLGRFGGRGVPMGYNDEYGYANQQYSRQQMGSYGGGDGGGMRGGIGMGGPQAIIGNGIKRILGHVSTSLAPSVDLFADFYTARFVSADRQYAVRRGDGACPACDGSGRAISRAGDSISGDR